MTTATPSVTSTPSAGECFSDYMTIIAALMLYHVASAAKEFPVVTVVGSGVGIALLVVVIAVVTVMVLRCNTKKGEKGELIRPPSTVGVILTKFAINTVLSASKTVYLFIFDLTTDSHICSLFSLSLVLSSSLAFAVRRAQR